MRGTQAQEAQTEQEGGAVMDAKRFAAVVSALRESAEDSRTASETYRDSGAAGSKALADDFRAEWLAYRDAADALEKMRAALEAIRPDAHNEARAGPCRGCDPGNEGEETLEKNMAWIGPPPTGPESFDSAREDAWVKGQAALALAKERP